MKNLLIAFSVLIISIEMPCIASLPPSIQAQEKLKEGKITYKITYPDSASMSEQMLAMMPKEMTTWFKEGKSRTELNMAVSNTITFYDPGTLESITCTDMNGRKKAVKITMDEAQAQKDKTTGEYVVKITPDKKKIAGYNARKAIITFKSDRAPMQLWFTNALDVETSGANTWKGISGFPLVYTVERKTMVGDIKMKMTCTAIEKVAVSDNQFTVPEGYKMTSKKEMMKQVRGSEKEIKQETKMNNIAVIKKDSIEEINDSPTDIKDSVK